MKKETEKYIKDVADKLYDTVKDTNLNYIELENLLGIPDSTLNSYMNYKRVATIENIYKICSKLGVSSDYLLRLSLTPMLSPMAIGSFSFTARS